MKNNDERMAEYLLLRGGILLHGHGPIFGIAPVAQWIRRLPTEQEILGSIPGGGRPVSFFHCVPFFLWTLLYGERRKLKNRADRRPGAEPPVCSVYYSISPQT